MVFQRNAWKQRIPLGIVEGARNAQRRLRLMAPSMDERGMPREGDFLSQEMDVGCVGNQALRKRQASWKQPLAEAATKTEPLTDSAARLCQLGGDENALWLMTNEGSECAPLDDMEFPHQSKSAFGPSRDTAGIMSTSTATETRWHCRSQVSGPL